MVLSHRLALLALAVAVLGAARGAHAQEATPLAPEPAASTAPAPAPARSAIDGRYLHGRSAALPGHLNGWVSQEELFLTTAVVGLGDHVAVGAGGLLPLLFAGRDYWNGWLMLKAGASIGEHLRIAGDVEAMEMPFLGKLALAQLLVGWETDRWSVTGGFGRELRLHDGGVGPGDYVGYLAGLWRLRPDVALLSESWFFVFLPDWDLSTVAGVRLGRHPYTFDAGVALTPFLKVPVPWFSVAIAY
jgi:hypothetical protein